ncbi:MAG: YlbF family regulator [Clostridia bacterium]|nr:YlbF family regulator [Clostridia bacterium]
MREVMLKAQALAEAILETGLYQNMQELEKQVTADASAAAAIADFVEKRDAFEAMLRNPDTAKGEFAAAGQAYAAAQAAVDENELIIQLREAQQKYNDLMDNVNRILRLVVTGETEEEGGCSGNCASCSGCH